MTRQRSMRGSAIGHQAFVCAGAIVLIAASAILAAPATIPSERLAVPKSLEQIKPDQAMHAQFKDDFAARDPATRSALSHKLLAAANEPGLDTPTQWVFLREAREQAIDAGDLNGAFAVIDSMNDAFVIDAHTMKISAMSAALDKALVPPGELTETYLSLVDRFLDDGDNDLAHNAAQLASDASHNTRDPTFKARISDADKRIAAARREASQISAALRKLKTNPTDPEASLLAGKYGCFVRGRWSAGLPLLAHSSDSTLKGLAEKEIANPDDASAKAEIADGWWSYAQALTGSAADKTRAHAAEWYQKALPGLTGPKRDEAAERAGSASKQGSP